MGGNTSRTMISNVASSIVAESFMKSVQSCIQTSKFEQTIEIRCVPKLIDPTVAFENGQACKECYERVLQLQEDTYDLWLLQWKQEQKITLPSYENDILPRLEMAEECKTSCKACVLDEVEQVGTFEWEANCTVSEETVNNLKSQVSVGVSQRLNTNSDIFSAVTTMLGASENSEVITTITQRISNKIDLDLVQAMAAAVDNSQHMEVISSNATVKKVSQRTAVAAVTNAVLERKVFNELFSSSEIKVLQDLVSKNSTLDAFGNLISLPSGVGSWLGDTVNKVMYAVLWTMVGLLWLVFFYVVYHFSQTYRTKYVAKRVLE